MRESGTIEAVSVAVRRGGRLLLVKRGRAPSLGLHAFPGGRVEAGETLEAAARRELLEETGMRAGALSPLEVMTLPAEDESKPGFHLSVFLCLDAAGDPIAGDDAAAAGFFTLDEMANLPMTESTLTVARTLLGADGLQRQPG